MLSPDPDLSYLIKAALQKYTDKWSDNFLAVLGICSFIFRANRSFFSERKSEKVIRSFVKSDESELLPSLFKKEHLSEGRRERFTLGHKKGKSSEKLSKTW